MPILHPVLVEVTARIVERSRDTRADDTRRMDAARDSGVGRARLSCANWGHVFAGTTPNVGAEKARVRALYAQNKVDRATLLESEVASYYSPGA